ncbi:MAG: hypothetical protein HYW22_00565 [Candidatus Aenigmarchaeota archaeon]|nr:hypothetical protein [Candidatus Aenigmarchaeota archaeon]
MGDCPFKPYISCYFSDRCPGNKPAHCTYDLLLAHGTSTLDKDAIENNYKVKPIEQVIDELNKADNYVFDESGNHRDFTKLRAGRKIEPYPFQPVSGDMYHIRGSEFVSRSHLGRLVGKMRFPVSFPDHYRDAGIAIDAVVTHQDHDDYVHNQTLSNPMNRNEYCQKEVFADIGGLVFMGHIDVSLRMGDTLVLLDVKRAAQSNPGHKKQLLSYALAVDRAGEFDDYVLVNMNHVNKISSRPMNPRFEVLHIDKGTSRMIPALSEEARKSFTIQQSMMANPDIMRALWELERPDGKKSLIYRGLVPYVQYLFDHMDERFDLLDPKFRRGLELAA